jgi:hypothetical protein
MNPSFEQTLIAVWRQTLVEDTMAVELDGSCYPVRRTPKRGLRQVDFIFKGNEIRELELKPDTRSEWAKLARSGKRVHLVALFESALGSCSTVIAMPA